jgi:hypothetical protein
LDNTAILPAVKRKYPESRIYWLTMENARKILYNNKFIDSLFVWNDENRMILRNLEFDYVMNKENNLFLIEDCIEAFGSLYNNKHTGTFGDISTFSFYGNKTIPTSEGGKVVTNDETLYERGYHLKMHELAKFCEYWHDVIGFNYRMTNICAAIGFARLRKQRKRSKRKES